MFALIPFVILGLFIALIVGLINPSKILPKSKNPTRLKVIWFWFLSMFVVIVAGTIYVGYNGTSYSNYVTKEKNTTIFENASGNNSVKEIKLNELNSKVSSSYKYEIINFENNNFRNSYNMVISRLKYKILLEEIYSELDIKIIANELIGIANKPDALEMLFCLPNADSNDMITAGKAVWAPNGRYEDAGSDDMKKLIFDFSDDASANLKKVNTKRNTESKNTIAKTYYYNIVKAEDLSYGKIKRLQYRVKLKENYSQNDLENISKEIISNAPNVNAISIGFYSNDSEVGGAYTVGQANYAPNGKWSDAAINSPKKLIVEYGSTLGEMPDDVVIDLPIYQKKKIFYDLVKYEDQGYSAKDAEKKIANEYNLSMDDVSNIAIEGIYKNWPMPQSY